MPFSPPVPPRAAHSLGGRRAFAFALLFLWSFFWLRCPGYFRALCPPFWFLSCQCWRGGGVSLTSGMAHVGPRFVPSYLHGPMHGAQQVRTRAGFGLRVGRASGEAICTTTGLLRAPRGPSSLLFRLAPPIPRAAALHLTALSCCGALFAWHCCPGCMQVFCPRLFSSRDGVGGFVEGLLFGASRPTHRRTQQRSSTSRSNGACIRARAASGCLYPSHPWR